jgi:hypothetical protein
MGVPVSSEIVDDMPSKFIMAVEMLADVKDKTDPTPYSNRALGGTRKIMKNREKASWRNKA